jgi:DNA-binding NarL/FixJ family response regulator
MKKLRVLVADDHRLMLTAVRRALRDADSLEIVGQVSAGTLVIPTVHETDPDVVLLDMRMPELDGLSCLKRLRAQRPDVAVVILSSYNDPELVQAAREGGAAGYVVKTVEPVDLGRVIRTAVESCEFSVWGLPVESPGSAALSVLSERESAVLEALSRGLSNREIGRQLWISEQTVKFHLRNIYRKLNLSSRAEAARYALSVGVAPMLAAPRA